MKRRRLWIILIALALVLGGGLAAGRFWSRSAGQGEAAAPVDERPAVEVAVVARGTLERTVHVSGSLTSERLVHVFPKRSGKVERVLVRDGEHVAAGRVLLILEDGDVRAMERQAAAALKAAEAQLALVRSGARPEQVAQAEEAVRQARAQVAEAEARLRALASGARAQERRQAEEAVRQAESAVSAAQTQLRLAQAALETAEVNVRRMEALFREGGVAQVTVEQARLEADRARAQVRAAEAQVQAARAQFRTAQQQQSLVEAGARAEEIDIARAQAEQARAGLRQAEQQLSLVRRGARAEEVRAAQAQVEQARAVWSQARATVDQLALRAPFAGVVARVRVTAGAFVSSGEFSRDPVLILYDDRALEADVTVGEREAGLLRPGQQGLLRPEAATGLTVRGVVKTITPFAEAGSRALSVRLRVLAVNAQRSRLIPGTFVRGEIVVERRAGTLVVPRAALRNGATPVVWVVTGGVIDVRPVRLGLSQGDRVEVLAGVREGEQVVVLGPETLANGALVRVVKGTR